MTFPERLNVCLDRGQLTISNLAVWFGRPRSTVKTWCYGRTPQGPTGRAALDRLTLLEWAIKYGQGFPIPEMTSIPERPDYLRGIRDGLEQRRTRAGGARVSGMRAAR
jgi:hypothetical protein